MKDLSLNLIAKETLGLMTLITQNNDEVDFSEQAVWKLKAALEQAYEAGKNSK